MANYFSQASFIVNLTPEQSIFSLDVASCINNEGLEYIKREADLKYLDYVVKVASACTTGFVDFSEQNLGFNIELTDEELWFSHDENIKFENIAVFIQTILAFFKLDKMVCFEGSLSTDQKRLGGFSGIACAITKDKIEWLSTTGWINKKIEAHKSSQ